MLLFQELRKPPNICIHCNAAAAWYWFTAENTNQTNDAAHISMCVETHMCTCILSLSVNVFVECSRLCNYQMHQQTEHNQAILNFKCILCFVQIMYKIYRQKIGEQKKKQQTEAELKRIVLHGTFTLSFIICSCACAFTPVTEMHEQLSEEENWHSIDCH